jgi:hypothetical protein
MPSISMATGTSGSRADLNIAFATQRLGVWNRQKIAEAVESRYIQVSRASDYFAVAILPFAMTFVPLPSSVVPPINGSPSSEPMQ